MNEMIERVARAINPWAFVALAEIHQRQATGEKLNQGWTDSVAAQVSHAIACARAAIAVMREPTDEMLKEGEEVAPEHNLASHD